MLNEISVPILQIFNLIHVPIFYTSSEIPRIWIVRRDHTRYIILINLKNNSIRRFNYIFITFYINIDLIRKWDIDIANLSLIIWSLELLTQKTLKIVGVRTFNTCILHRLIIYANFKICVSFMNKSIILWIWWSFKLPMEFLIFLRR